MSLSDEQLERYSRQVILPEIGIAGQERLLASRVLVPGCTPSQQTAADYLAASGVTVDRETGADQRYEGDCALLGPNCMEMAAGLLEAGTPVACYSHANGQATSSMALVPSDKLAPEEPPSATGHNEPGLEQAAACEAACLCVAWLLRGEQA